MAPPVVKCKCGELVDATDKKILDEVVCRGCGQSIYITPKRLEEGDFARRNPQPMPRESFGFEPPSGPGFDVFISHATEDKESFAHPLAVALELRGLRVWYDSWSMGKFDSIQRAIDVGLSRSLCGVVICSPNYLHKSWARLEMGAICGCHAAGMLIATVLHGILPTELRSISPLLAGTLVVTSTDGVDEVADAILAHMQTNSGRLWEIASSNPERELADIRLEMIISPDHAALMRCLDLIEVFLGRYPHVVDGRILKRQLLQAIERELQVESREDLAGQLESIRREYVAIEREAKANRRRVGISCLIFGVLAGMAVSFGIKTPKIRESSTVATVAASSRGDDVLVLRTPPRELQFQLIWKSSSDLDLSVIDPTGATVSNGATEIRGGSLDRDLLAGPGQETITVDPAAFESFARRAQKYLVTVNDYSQLGETEFELRVLVDGIVDSRIVGVLDQTHRSYLLELFVPSHSTE